jgi:undecaprenyl-diphosphatase
LSDYLLSAVLGIVEGLTEFLPISSTAHLRIVEAIFKIPMDDEYWKMYTIVIQLGAILCLPVYFRARIAEFMASLVQGRRRWINHPVTLVLISFCVTAVPSFLLSRIIGKHLESFHVMGTAILVGGIVMGSVDAWRSPWESAGPQAPATPIRTWFMEDMSLAQAVWIGACQILSALFPGTSRSMSTIVGGQLACMSRSSALEFSFFLSMPTMLAATAYDLFKTLRGQGTSASNLLGRGPQGWIVLLIGFVVSFVVAYGSVAWLMSWVRKRGFVPFAVYRIGLGIAVLIWATRAAN